MKTKILWAVMVISLCAFPTYSGAATILETTGWIIGEEGFSFDFVADTAPFTYEATITDLSISPAFGLTDIFLSITTSTEVLDYRLGEGSIIFPVVGGNTYFANVFAQGAGDIEAGNFGLIVETVPVPGAV
jgi:hypothetical protein